MKRLLRIFFCSLLILHLARGHDGHTGSTDSTNRFSEEGCNEQKGCFLCEDGCGGNAAWEPFENVIHFTVWGPLDGDTGYIAMGISLDNMMFSADVYACIVNGGVGTLKRYWNPASPGRGPMPATLKGVTDVDVSMVDGEIRCKFTRNMTLNDGDPQFYDISGNSSNFLLLASATSLNGDDITYHSKRSASQAVVLSQTFSASAGAEPGLDLMKAHGCLMIIAWIGLVSVGITLARYYKPMWPNSKIGGVKVWFALHRACMVTALLMFVSAFVIIFVHVGNIITLETPHTPDSRRRFAHTVLGLIVTGLGILNPTMALCRPHPGTPKRPIFNWAHWGVGTSALLLAYATVALALVELSDTTIIPGLDGYALWVLVAFGVFHVLMWVILEILRCTTDSNGKSFPCLRRVNSSALYHLFNEDQGRTDDIPLGGKGDDPAPMSNDIETPQGSVLKNILLALYVLGAVFAIAFMVITIAIV